MKTAPKGTRARLLTALGFGFFIDSAEDVAPGVCHARVGARSRRAPQRLRVRGYSL